MAKTPCWMSTLFGYNIRKLICALCLFLASCGDKPTLNGQEFHTTQNGIQITLGFGTHDNRYYGKAVNSYYGTYQVQGNTIQFSSPASTMYFADSEDLQAEETFLDTLPRIHTYHLSDNTLILTDENNHSIILQK